MHTEINYKRPREEGGETTIMHKIPQIWPSMPVSGTRLISWAAAAPAFGTSNFNSSKYQTREIVLKIS